jgi:hypothetical protein
MNRNHPKQKESLLKAKKLQRPILEKSRSGAWRKPEEKRFSEVAIEENRISSRQRGKPEGYLEQKEEGT